MNWMREKLRIHGRRRGSPPAAYAEQTFDEDVTAGRRRRGHGADDIGLADQATNAPETGGGRPERRDGGRDGGGVEVDVVRARGARRVLPAAGAGGTG